MARLPYKTLYFCRDYISGLIPYLESIGYTVKVESADVIHSKWFDIHDDAIIVVWSGGYRKATNDHPEISPNILHAEQGFLPHYTSVHFDPRGHGSASSLIGNLNDPITDEQEIELAAFLSQNYYLNRPCELSLPDRYWLLLLQHVQDSVMMWDAPAYARDPSMLIRSVQAQLPAGTQLVVKPHPLHKPRGLRTSGAIVVDGQGDAKLDHSDNSALNQHLIRNAEGVITVNSSFVFEALAYDKPVITLGTSVFTGNNVTKEAPRVNESLFDDLVCDSTRNKAFLYELCLRKQIMYSNPAPAEQWADVEDRYTKYWRTECTG